MSSLPIRIDKPQLAGRALSAADVVRHLSQQGFIQFHPALATKLGSFKAAVWMGHALYWTRHLALKQPRRGGWFYMTASQCEQATGLSAREQTNVRQQLRSLGLIEEMLAGKPAKLHFRVKLPVLTQWTGFQGDACELGAATWDAFAPWLGSSVCFYKSLAVAAGSVAAGLYLSLLLQRQRNSLTDNDGCFYLPQQEVAKALCLGCKVQRNARERLRQAGLLHERRGGMVRLDLQTLMQRLVPDWHEREAAIEQASHACLRIVRDAPEMKAAPAVVTVRRWLQKVNADTKPPLGSTAGRAQMALFDQTDAPKTQEAVQAAPLVRRMFGASPAMQRQPRLVEPRPDSPAAAPITPIRLLKPIAVLSKLESAVLSKQGGAVAQNAKLDCRFVETNLPFCRNHIQRENNKTTTTTVREAGPDASFDKTAGRRRRPLQIPLGGSANDAAARQDIELVDLAMPRNLDAAWHEAVRRTVAEAPADARQALLDELEGQLGIEGKVIHNPPGYLHTLICKHVRGELTLALAEKVAATRQQQKIVARTIEIALDGRAANAATAITVAKEATPPPPEIRARLKQLSQMLRSGGGQ